MYVHTIKNTFFLKALYRSFFFSYLKLIKIDNVMFFMKLLVWYRFLFLGYDFFLELHSTYPLRQYSTVFSPLGTNNSIFKRNVNNVIKIIFFNILLQQSTEKHLI